MAPSVSLYSHFSLSAGKLIELYNICIPLFQDDSFAFEQCEELWPLVFSRHFSSIVSSSVLPQIPRVAVSIVSS